jgi:leader peptidase (prepilin peptidase)/N-methyltransferase
MLVIPFTLLGMIIGSFLNVCIDRIPKGGSILSPPSRCDTCGHRLLFIDLIPILSYLTQKGKCRYCKASIPLRNPLVELGTGALFALIWMRYPSSINAILVACYSAFLIVILAIDLEHHKVLNRLTYPAIVLALITIPFTPAHNYWELLLGGVIGFAILFLVALVYPAGMGMGDVKLAAFIGLALGYPGILMALFLAFVIGGLLSGGLVLAHLIGRRDPIAFAPFMAVGAITTMLYGDQILLWWAGRI